MCKSSSTLKIQKAALLELPTIERMLPSIREVQNSPLYDLRTYESKAILLSNAMHVTVIQNI